MSGPHVKARRRGELEQHLSSLAELFGWLHHRERCPGLTRDSIPDGFPAHVLVRGGRLVFVVIAGGPLTPPETGWIEVLTDVTSVEVRILNPSDLRAATRILEDAPASDGGLIAAADHR